MLNCVKCYEGNVKRKVIKDNEKEIFRANKEGYFGGDI